MELSEKIAVMKAAERGEKIQYSDKYAVAWCYVRDPVWDWDKYDYRVAPRVFELPGIWCVFVGSDLLVAAASKEIAERVFNASRDGYPNCVLSRFVRAGDD